MACREGGVLLPAYVGWSSTEGSGVFDPVQQLNVPFEFYRVTRDLWIDLDDLCAKISSGSARVLLLIHYFGYPDPALAEAVACARRHGVSVLEDEAHAFFSDWVGGVCGRLGDAAVMSIHKVLPVDSGGLLVLNPTIEPATLEKLQNAPERRDLELNLLDYDLPGIADCRRRHALELLEQIKSLSPRITALRPDLPRGVAPQTLPVLVNTGSRDELHRQLNACGYGVVSLYHTLISPISPSDFPESHWLSRRILNLPVHQDVEEEAIGAMLRRLTTLIEDSPLESV